jgi:hypothetical protein
LHLRSSAPLCFYILRDADVAEDGQHLGRTAAES